MSQLYIVGFYSASLLPAAKRHYGLLLPIDIPNSWTKGEPSLDSDVPEMVESQAVKRRFFCGSIFSFRNKWCHMSAGTCLHVNENNQLMIYGVSHYLKPHDKYKPDHASFVRCTEFSI